LKKERGQTTVMTIVGRNPESGIRLMIERVRDEGPPWTYEGAAYTPRSTHPVRIVVEISGEVVVEVETETPPDLVQRTRQMVRAAYKHAQDSQQPPPRQIHRWKGSSGAW
jgi:hypothetical protein